jgi:hypothetical protein
MFLLTVAAHASWSLQTVWSLVAARPFLTERNGGGRGAEKLIPWEE